MIDDIHTDKIALRASITASLERLLTQNYISRNGDTYQYYNTELKDDTFAQLKKNVKITKERIPAATQLFTPDWIVRYMVENSLGRLWLEGHPNAELHDDWKYYLDEAEQEPGVDAQLAKLREEYTTIKPEEIKVIDPCMGSGHILVYAFDVLMQIYTSAGWDQREAAQSILKNNLYGLDIDDRAAQLAYFAVMMKARQYDRRLLTRGIQPNIHSIIESNALGGAYKLAMGDFLLSKEHQETLNYLLDAFIDAKEYGSILCLEKRDYVGLLRAWNLTASQTTENLNLTLWFAAVEHEIPKLIEQAIILTQGYDVVVTNPPYMAVSNAGAKVNDYVKKNFPDSKADLFAVFIERCGQMAKKNGYQAMITQPSFLFLTSFESLRKKVIATRNIENLLHMGRGIFGVDFGSTAFIIRNGCIHNYKGVYFRLHERTFQYIDPDDIESLYIRAKKDHSYEYSFAHYDTEIGIVDQPLLIGKKKIYYESIQDNFLKIPGSPVAFWVSNNFVENYSHTKFADYAEVITGMTIGDNNKHLRLWYEVESVKEKFNASSMDEVDLSKTKWIPYSKGGPRRNWYGNYEYVVNWSQKDHFNRSKTTLQHLYLQEGITWPFIASGDFSARFLPKGFLWDVAGSPCFFKDEITLKYALATLCSKSINYILKVVNPTINVQAIDIAQLPFMVDTHLAPLVVNNTDRNISISAEDWDSYETSWDFKRNPLV